MELLDATDAAALTTAVTSFVTANIAAVLVIVGFFVGLRFIRSMINKSVKGKI